MKVLRMGRSGKVDRADLIARGTPPEACGDAIPVAPARGLLRAFMPVELAPDGKGGTRPVDAGYRGRAAARVEDAFDRMDRARRGKGPAPFTPAQVQMGRFYATLTERVASAGVKGTSLEALSQRSGGGNAGFMDAVIDDSRRLAALHARIGGGVAMSVRRIRPSARGSRREILDRGLVDAVCLGGMMPDQVLRSAGWAVNGRHRAALRAALSEALDRMIGYN